MALAIFDITDDSNTAILGFANNEIEALSLAEAKYGDMALTIERTVVRFGKGGDEEVFAVKRGSKIIATQRSRMEQFTLTAVTTEARAAFDGMRHGGGTVDMAKAAAVKVIRKAIKDTANAGIADDLLALGESYLANNVRTLRRVA